MNIIDEQTLELFYLPQNGLFKDRNAFGDENDKKKGGHKTMSERKCSWDFELSEMILSYNNMQLFSLVLLLAGHVCVRFDI